MDYPKVILYTKDKCGLCIEVKLELQHLHLTYPHRLIEIDIEQDRDLFAQYFDKIPAVKVGDVELVVPITAVQLRTALQNANAS